MLEPRGPVMEIKVNETKAKTTVFAKNNNTNKNKINTKILKILVFICEPSSISRLAAGQKTKMEHHHIRLKCTDSYQRYKMLKHLFDLRSKLIPNGNILYITILANICTYGIQLFGTPKQPHFNQSN